MNIFDLLRYRSDRPYLINPKTNVCQYTSIGGGSHPVGSDIYYGSTNITSIYYGSTPVTAMYYGSLQVF